MSYCLIIKGSPKLSRKEWGGRGREDKDINFGYEMNVWLGFKTAIKRGRKLMRLQLPSLFLP